MNWLSDNWKILFSGVAGTAVVTIIGFLLKRWLGSKEQPSGQLTAQGARVENSPVASGSNISQTVHSPTFNIALPTLASRLTENDRPTPRTLANIIQTTIRQTELIRSGRDGAYGMAEFGQRAVIVTFRNEAQAGRPNVGALVRALITLADEDGTEHTSYSGPWLDQLPNITEFRVDDTRHLILAFVEGDEFCGIESRLERTAEGDVYTPLVHRLPDYHRGIITVRLTDANRGDVLYEGRFRFVAQPFSIERAD